MRALGIALVATVAASCTTAVPATDLTVQWTGHADRVTALTRSTSCGLVTAAPCLAMTGATTDTYFGKPVNVTFAFEIAQSAAAGALSSGMPLDLCETDPATARMTLTVADAASGAVDLAYDSMPLYGMPPATCTVLVDIQAQDGSIGDIHASVDALTPAALPAVVPAGAASASVGGSYRTAP